MALEIMLVKDPAIPYWEDSQARQVGEIDPMEWESFFFGGLNIERVTEYPGSNAENYNTYYVNRIAEFSRRFPLTSRIKDYYMDAFFSREEVELLIRELVALKTLANDDASVAFLNTILRAGEEALRSGMGISLIAD